MTADEFRDFVTKRHWRFARTMPENPHSYTLRAGADDELFLRAVVFIRENGYQEVWGGRLYTYYSVGGEKFWTMGAPLTETILINRAAADRPELSTALRSVRSFVRPASSDAAASDARSENQRELPTPDPEYGTTTRGHHAL